MTMLEQDTTLTGGRGTPNAWSPASNGHTWTQVRGNQTLSYDATNHLLVLTYTSSNATAIIYLGSSSAANQEILVNATSSATNDIIGAAARIVDNTHYYQIELGNSLNTLEIRKNVGGTFATIGSAPFTYAANTKYSFRFNLTGTTLKGKVWSAGSSEPDWMITCTDSSIASGCMGVAGAPATTGHTVSFDTFSATDAPLQLGVQAEGAFKVCAAVQSASTTRFLSRAPVTGQARAPFLVRSLQAGQACDSFSVRAGQTSAANDTFPVRAASASTMHARALVRAEQQVAASSRFLISTLTGLLVFHARILFQVRTRSLDGGQARFLTCAQMANEAEALFQIRARVSVQARPRFIIRAAVAVQARTRTLARAAQQTIASALVTVKSKVRGAIASRFLIKQDTTIHTPLSVTFQTMQQLFLFFLSRQQDLFLRFATIETLTFAFLKRTSMATPNSTIKTSTTVTDANGNVQATVSSISCTVTLPDGAVLHPTVTNAGAGVYTVTYTTNAATGLIREVWTVVAADGMTDAEAQNLIPVSL